MGKVVFNYTVTLDHATAISAEYTQELQLTAGTIKEVQITFPSGCAGLVGVRFYRWTRQVIPDNVDEYIATDGETVILPVTIDLTAEPYALEFRGYNLDDYYDHTIRVRFIVETPEPKTYFQEQRELVQTLLEAVKREVEEDEEEEEEEEEIVKEV